MVILIFDLKESTYITMKLDMFQVRRDDRKKKKLGKIQINRKKNMKSFLKDYNNDNTDSRYLAKLYTSDDEKFYWS